MQIQLTAPGTDIKNIAGTAIEISWDELLPAIKQNIRLRDDEVIDGIIVTEEAIKVNISRKPGRKRNH
ncbi:MAG: hypothetical protein JST87_05470 [Bacteroidetes bacterium]|nr:hypothetical protein [Bacteroidota bacterium]